MGGIHHSTTMVSSGSFCFLVLGVPLPTPDPLNVHIHLDDVMKKDMESAGKSEKHGKDYGDHKNYPVVPDEKPVLYGEAEHGNEKHGEDYGDHKNYPVVPDEKPVLYGEAEHGNEMNIGSIGN